MNAYSSLSPVLSHQHFYILLALLNSDLHAYAIYGSVGASSMGTVSMSRARTYAAMQELVAAGLVIKAGWDETGKQEKPRMMYRITPEGKLRVADDLKRMRQAVETGERAGVFFDELPAEIQRLLNEVR